MQKKPTNGTSPISRERAIKALSGPVPRGDAELIRRQLARLDAAAPDIAALYRPLLWKAVAMAQERGDLDADAAHRLQQALAHD